MIHMSIFLDYHKEEGEVIAMSVLDESNTYYDFSQGQLQNVTEFLIEPGFIVVFGAPQAPLLRVFDHNPVLEEYGGIAKRWLDLKTFLRKETRLTPSISGMAAGTLEETDEAEITDLERTSGGEGFINLSDKLHERLRAVKGCYDIAMATGKLSFYFKKELYIVDFDLTEPLHPMAMD